MISQTHYGHFILSTDSGEHVVLDGTAKELRRYTMLADAMDFCKRPSPPSKPFDNEVSPQEQEE